MKGLLLKDWYTLIKQMKIMLVLMLVFCVRGCIGNHRIVFV